MRTESDSVKRQLVYLVESEVEQPISLARQWGINNAMPLQILSFSCSGKFPKNTEQAENIVVEKLYKEQV